MAQTGSTHLPLLKPPFQLVGALTIALAALLVAASLVGLLAREALYPTLDLLKSSLPNDAANLIIGLPALLGSLWLARRGSLVGLLCWPGALLYVFYSYAAYLFAAPLGWATFLYLFLVALSAYAFIMLLLSIDFLAVQRQLTGYVPVRLAGGALFGLGLLFLLRVVGLWVSRAPLTIPEQAVQIADLLTMPVWVVGGVLLWLRRPLGYTVGLGLLFQGSTLFLALLLVLFLQPILTPVPSPMPEDIAVIAAFSLVCLFPFVLFLRRVLIVSDSNTLPSDHCR